MENSIDLISNVILERITSLEIVSKDTVF